MLPRISYVASVLKNMERNLLHMFGHPPRGKTRIHFVHQHNSILAMVASTLDSRRHRHWTSLHLSLRSRLGNTGILAVPELALAYVHESKLPVGSKFSLKDLVGDGFLLAVPKFRRTIEKRLIRKFGSPDYVWKMLVPKTNIKVCHECGTHHESGRLCEKCYKRVEKETKEIQAKIREKLGNGPIEKDVVVLYEGENLPDQPNEFWKGKRIIEMKKERPQWISKNLLQKSTQQPSKSTDVKPTDLA